MCPVRVPALCGTYLCVHTVCAQHVWPCARTRAWVPGGGSAGGGGVLLWDGLWSGWEAAPCTPSSGWAEPSPGGDTAVPGYLCPQQTLQQWFPKPQTRGRASPASSHAARRRPCLLATTSSPCWSPPGRHLEPHRGFWGHLCPSPGSTGQGQAWVPFSSGRGHFRQSCGLLAIPGGPLPSGATWTHHTLALVLTARDSPASCCAPDPTPAPPAMIHSSRLLSGVQRLNTLCASQCNRPKSSSPQEKGACSVGELSRVGLAGQV